MLPPAVERKISEIKKDQLEVLHTVSSDLGTGFIHVLSRPMTLAEAYYHEEVVARDQESAKEFVVRTTTIEVYSTASGKFIPITQMPLGLYDEVYGTVVEGSGINPEAIKEYVAFYRAISTQTHMQAIAFICKAFSGYTPRDIERMTVHELAKNIALAELIHKTEFSIITEEDVAREQTQKESGVIAGIRKQAKVNDKMMGIDFSKENADLQGAMR